MYYRLLLQNFVYLTLVKLTPCYNLEFAMLVPSGVLSFPSVNESNHQLLHVQLSL